MLEVLRALPRPIHDVPGVREPAVRAAVAEEQQLDGVHVAQQAAQGLGTPALVVGVSL